MERFNLKLVNDMEVKEQYQVKISNRFVAFENLGWWIRYPASVRYWREDIM
jgi:hypothetical protein